VWCDREGGDSGEGEGGRGRVVCTWVVVGVGCCVIVM